MTKLLAPGFALSDYDHSSKLKLNRGHGSRNDDVIESKQAVVAADDGRCSEIGVSMLEKGGHAVDAAVATAICLGVVGPMSSGIGGGAFMVVRSSSAPGALAIDMRETAPAAASEVTPLAKLFSTTSIAFVKIRIVCQNEKLPVVLIIRVEHVRGQCRRQVSRCIGDGNSG